MGDHVDLCLFWLPFVDANRTFWITPTHEDEWAFLFDKANEIRNLEKEVMLSQVH